VLSGSLVVLLLHESAFAPATEKRLAKRDEGQRWRNTGSDGAAAGMQADCTSTGAAGSGVVSVRRESLGARLAGQAKGSLALCVRGSK
jgi:hypothetical protein